MAQCIQIVQEHLGVTEDYIWKHILVVVGPWLDIPHAPFLSCVICLHCSYIYTHIGVVNGFM